MRESGKGCAFLSPARLSRVLLPLTAVCIGLAHAGTTSYTYDDLGRLKSVTATGGANQSVTTYTYDSAGNRQSVVTAIIDSTPPNPPTGLTAVAQAPDRIRLNWTTSLDVGGGPVLNYRVYRGGVSVASPAVPPYDDQPLNPNTTYNYNVSAVDPSGNESTQSGSAGATTPPGADVTPPSVPTGLQGAAVSGTWVNLTWTASQDNPGGTGLAGYEIFRDNGVSPLGSSTVASYSDQTANMGVANLYTVRAYDVAGNRSALSSQISVTTFDTQAPSPPSSLSFSSITTTSVLALWGAASDNVGVTGYRYRLNAGSWINMGLSFGVTASGLAPGTNYTMDVQATDQAGNWGLSVTNSFTTVSASYTDTGTMTIGNRGNNVIQYTERGYRSVGTPLLGSYSPTALTGVKTLLAYYEFIECYPCTPDTTHIAISGFNSDPGPAWLISADIGAGNVYGTDPNLTYSYSDGTAVWEWVFSNLLPASGTRTGTIVHQ